MQHIGRENFEGLTHGALNLMLCMLLKKEERKREYFVKM